MPNRNQLFITLAHSYAQKIGAESLVAGMCETDFSGYPDCREAFIKLLESVTNLGSKSNIKIYTPLMFLTKADTFQLADNLDCLDTVIKESHTCYNGNRDNFHEWGYGCDNCSACELRRKGYEEYLKIRNS